MKYDPIKKTFGNIVSKNIFLRKLFYKLLDLMFLRSWHVRRKIKKLYESYDVLDIYDAGMGFGQYTYFLSNYFPFSKIYAGDIKEEQVNDCQYFFSKIKKHTVKFGLEDLTKINFSGRFDFILCVDVMEHIAEDELVFANFYKALKNKGKVLINTPSIYGGSDAHSEDDESFIEEHARTGYSEEEITLKLKKAGLEVTEFYYTYGKFGTLSWKLGIKYPILIIGKSKILVVLLPFYYLLSFWLTLILMWFDVLVNNKTGSGIVLIAEKK